MTTSALDRSRYRCRTHHDQAVTWRGTGCGICADPSWRHRFDEQHRADHGGVTDELPPLPPHARLQ